MKMVTPNRGVSDIFVRYIVAYPGHKVCAIFTIPDGCPLLFVTLFRIFYRRFFPRHHLVVVYTSRFPLSWGYPISRSSEYSRVNDEKTHEDKIHLIRSPNEGLV